MKYNIEIPQFLKNLDYTKLDTKHNPIEFVYDMDCNLIGIFFSLTRKDKLINLTVKYDYLNNKIPEVYSGIFSNSMEENFDIAIGGKINYFKYFKYYKRMMFSIPVENEKLIRLDKYEIYHRFPNSYSGYRTLGKTIQKYYNSYYLRQKSEVIKFKESTNEKIYNFVESLKPDYVTFYQNPNEEPDKFFISYYKENKLYNTAFNILKKYLQPKGVNNLQ